MWHKTLILNALTCRTDIVKVLPIVCVCELGAELNTTLFCFALLTLLWPLFHWRMQRIDKTTWLHLKLHLSRKWSISSCSQAGRKVWMFLLLSSLSVILAAPQQMARWWCLRSGHVSASSALCPLCRPPPRHPMTNYFLFVTETQSSEGRGVFCCRSIQANLRVFPPVGHSWLDLGLVFKLFNWGHWEAEIWFLVFKAAT